MQTAEEDRLQNKNTETICSPYLKRLNMSNQAVSLTNIKKRRCIMNEKRIYRFNESLEDDNHNV